MAATSSLYAGGKSVKSVQRGSSTTAQAASTVTTTINAVVLAKSLVTTHVRTSYAGYDGSAYASMNWHYGAALTATTTLSLYPGLTRAASTAANATVYWEVVEFE